MSRNDIVRANSAAVITSEQFGLGRSWSFARLTSNRGVDPRTYETFWTEFKALDTGGTSLQDFDEQRSRWKQTNTIPLRCAENSPSPQLAVGDLVRSPDGLTYSVEGIAQSGPGTVRYTVSRDPTLRGDMARGGGV